MEELPEFRRDVLVSIRPIYASRILEGAKTVELRRRFPEGTAIGATAVIYSTSPVSAVVGVAQIKDVLRLPVPKIWRRFSKAACISKKDFDAYFGELEFGFVILLCNAKHLTHQLTASQLMRDFGIVPPQSYRYLHRSCAALLANEHVETASRHQRGDRA